MTTMQRPRAQLPAERDPWDSPRTAAAPAPVSAPAAAPPPAIDPNFEFAEVAQADVGAVTVDSDDENDPEMLAELAAMASGSDDEDGPVAAPAPAPAPPPTIAAPAPAPAVDPAMIANLDTQIRLKRQAYPKAKAANNKALMMKYTKEVKMLKAQKAQLVGAAEVPAPPAPAPAPVAAPPPAIVAALPEVAEADVDGVTVDSDDENVSTSNPNTSSESQ